MKKIIPSFIKRSIRDLVINEGEIIHSYAQSNEDLVLKRYFNRKIWAKQTGFFVDIGAYHPVKYSNTYLFYQYGWRGINIDANPGNMDLFREIRPNDINLECAISSTGMKLDYYMAENYENLNTFSKEFLERNSHYTKITKTIKLQTVTLSSVLDQHLPSSQSIDFLSIDVEGFEIEVLKSNKWDKYRPSVVLIEMPGISFEDIMKHDITQFLMNVNYYPFDRTILYGEKNIGGVFFHDKLKEFYPKF